MRLFLGFDVEAEGRQRLARELARLRELAPAAKWVAPGNVHLTLVFLGSVDEARVLGVVEAAGAVAARRDPPSLALAGAGVFGASLRPSVLWVGVAGDLAALAALQAELARALAAIVPLPDGDRAFSPHVTLARARGRGGDPGLAACASSLAGGSLGAVATAEIALFRSDTGPSGSSYTKLAGLPLRAR